MGKSSHLPTSTLISQNCAAWRRLFLVFLGAGGFSPSLMNCMDDVGLVLVWCFFVYPTPRYQPVHKKPCHGAICIFPGWELVCNSQVCAPLFLSLCIVFTMGPPSFPISRGLLVMEGCHKLNGAGKRCKSALLSRSQGTWSSALAGPTLSRLLVIQVWWP